MKETCSTGASSVVGDIGAGTSSIGGAGMSSIGGAGMSSIVNRRMVGASSMVELSCNDPVCGRSEKVATGVVVTFVDA